MPMDVTRVPTGPASPVGAKCPTRFAAVAFLGLVAAVGFAPMSHAVEPEKIVFNRDIRPILSENCFACHGPDKNQRKADLRLDIPGAAVKQGAIVAGKADESELIARIESTDPDEVMPPTKAAKKPLTAEEKALLKRWVAEGAVFQDHWAYEKPVKPAIPAGANPIDFLVERRLTPKGAKLSPEADRRTLARRLYLDLLGLPPTPEQVQAFVDDKAPDAYAKLVERLLDSPHYGERMAIGWLDVVRFADSIGYHSDNPMDVWPYRDYVIRAFNRNMPFDRFTVEQLAGDLLPGSTVEQKVASGFNRLLLTTQEGGAQPKDYEARMLSDRVRAVGTVWLGHTFGCCQCHDHKFDPITARDFYSLGAFFADIQEPIIGMREPGMIVADANQTAERARLRKILDTIQERCDNPPSASMPAYAADRVRLDAAKKALDAYEARLPHSLVSISGSPRTVRILPRGNFMDETGPVVTPTLPQYLAKETKPEAEKKPLNRLDLAKWIVSNENPLTARVLVNRLWKQFFGIGLSKTPDDFGSQGEWPVNPELLDWLACDFRENGWDIKRIVREIVNSRSYKQVSTASKEWLARDPANREVARQGRFRLDAEIVRDNALAISGLLVREVGGPSVKPYQPAGYWENLNFPPREYVADTAPEQYRRGLYTWWQRTFPNPSLLAFDAPTREECAADRARSNTPQQALVLLNDPTYVEAARAFAARILREGGADTASRIRWAWQQAVQHDPIKADAAEVAKLVDTSRSHYAADPKAADALLAVGSAPRPSDIAAAELAAWTNAARVILNLHETVTRN